VARATRQGDEAGASSPDVNSAVLSVFSAALCVTKKCKKGGGWLCAVAVLILYRIIRIFAIIWDIFTKGISHE